MPWFAIKLLGLPRWTWAVMAVVLIIAGGLLWAKLAEDADDKRNVELGRTVEREKALAETITKVEKANEAAETIRRDPDAARAECLSNARNPEDC